MKVGFSLSPGGLLLPYHLGVLEGLKYNGFLDESTPIAGSSAGSIAAASFGCGVDSRKVLESTIQISDRCQELGGARGRLLPLLREQLYANVGDEEFEFLRERKGAVGIAYKEVFPRYRPIVQTTFEDRHDLVNSVCHSSMFPFFSSNWPFALDTSKRFPRLVVDGFFTVPRDKFGCPDFKIAGVDIDRTISVCVFPQESIGLNASSREDCISPAMEGGDQLQRLLKLATESSSRQELTSVYESGFADAERWCRSQTLGESSSMEKILETNAVSDLVSLN